MKTKKDKYTVSWVDTFNCKGAQNYDSLKSAIEHILVFKRVDKELGTPCRYFLKRTR